PDKGSAIPIDWVAYRMNCDHVSDRLDVGYWPAVVRDHGCCRNGRIRLKHNATVRKFGHDFLQIPASWWPMVGWRL
ncbi:Hypothetical predicted protein, partial [Olea europaea subsp. europaea]